MFRRPAMQQPVPIILSSRGKTSLPPSEMASHSATLFFPPTFGCFLVSVTSKCEVVLSPRQSGSEGGLLELIDKPLLLMIRVCLLSSHTTYGPCKAPRFPCGILADIGNCGGKLVGATNQKWQRQRPNGENEAIPCPQQLARLIIWSNHNRSGEIMGTRCYRFVGWGSPETKPWQEGSLKTERRGCGLLIKPEAGCDHIASVLWFLSAVDEQRRGFWVDSLYILTTQYAHTTQLVVN